MSDVAQAAAVTVFAPRDEGPWLFGRRVDLTVFGGSALLSGLLLALGAALGILHGDSPAWVWLFAVLAVDVAHVWSTAFRVYLDPAEVRRRPALYLGLPTLCYALGVAAHGVSAALFWRVLAYVAVFHFVRQQYGWVALYQRRDPTLHPAERWLDAAAIYACCLFPLLHWHAHLPRAFTWFVQDDFVPGVPAALVQALEPVYWGILAAFVARQGMRGLRGDGVAWGKLLVVATTWACWYIGIVALNSDYAFTVTNVLIHGIPYLALTYRYGRGRARQQSEGLLSQCMRGGVPLFLGLCVLAAFAEETLWDLSVWHDREWLFGTGPWLPESWFMWLVPLLALPQATHYALDGFIWRTRRGNPTLRHALTSGAPP